jgi:SAM-dependent MidA family methyltransferase
VSPPVTSLGIPALPPPTSHPTWKSAWDSALYGPDGFFRRQAPAAHFRTSVHASPLFAGALVRLLHHAGLDTLVDIGAGRGELLAQVRALEPSLTLLGVEVAPRPADLPADIGWTSALPESVEGLVVANEWLDNIPCHVVEVDASGVARVVHVDPGSGEEVLGASLGDRSVPAALTAWCERWWPVTDAPQGTRAEVGTTRDAAWADVVGRVSRGVAIAVDYGHTLPTRPPLGSLASYADGRRVDVRTDGSRDVTAHVAVDSVAERTGAGLVRQRTALERLGVSGRRPPLDLARSDPAGYLSRLGSAGEATELCAEGGLGDFWWVVSSVDGVRTPLT